MKSNLKFVAALVSLTTAAKLAAQPQPGTVLWTYQAGNPISSSPALASDGTVYLVSGLLTAITNSGSMASNKWSFPAGGPPAVGADGTIYTVNGGLYAVTPDGIQKWFYPAAGAAGSAGIGLDGTIYFVAQGRLYAISASSAEKWDYLLEPYPSLWSKVNSPVLGTDGTIYTGLWNALSALGPDGTNKWSTTLSFYAPDSPAIGAAGTIYSFTDVLNAVSPSGTNLWSASVGHGHGGSPVIGQDDTLYVADDLRALSALTPDGPVSWRILTNAPRYGSLTAPAVDAGGRIYYCVSNSVWALNPQGQVQWNISIPPGPFVQIDSAITSPIIGPDGTLYAALGTTLYAIATGTNGPANSPWPMYRQNARHTGKVEKPALKQPKKRADANFEFQLYAQLGQTNTVESTTDLSTWTSLASVLVTNVPMDFVDLTASNFPSRFYRALSP